MDNRDDSFDGFTYKEDDDFTLVRFDIVDDAMDGLAAESFIPLASPAAPERELPTAPLHMAEPEPSPAIKAGPDPTPVDRPLRSEGKAKPPAKDRRWVKYAAAIAIAAGVAGAGMATGVVPRAAEAIGRAASALAAATAQPPAAPPVVQEAEQESTVDAEPSNASQAESPESEEPAAPTADEPSADVEAEQEAADSDEVDGSEPSEPAEDGETEEDAAPSDDAAASDTADNAPSNGGESAVQGEGVAQQQSGDAQQQSQQQTSSSSQQTSNAAQQQTQQQPQTETVVREFDPVYGDPQTTVTPQDGFEANVSDLEELGYNPTVTGTREYYRTSDGLEFKDFESAKAHLLDLRSRGIEIYIEKVEVENSHWSTFDESEPS